VIIEIEGIDGVGKTTQCRLLKNWLESRGSRAIVVKDLETTLFGRQIKSILITDSPRSNQAELFAFLCCKSQLFTEVVEQELERGTHVICDRGIGSFLSYFEVFGFNRELLLQLLSIAVPNEPVTPVTFLIDLEVREALTRNLSKSAHSKFDGMGTRFFEDQRNVFLDLARANRWTVVDGRGSVAEVHEAIVSALDLPEK
jgi:dTMP kinase